MSLKYSSLLSSLIEDLQHESSSSLIHHVALFLNQKHLNMPKEIFEKLTKQLSYDYLVHKRRIYPNTALDGCANPASFPDENSPFDIVNHIDCLSAWTQEYEEVVFKGMKFHYLCNLDAEYIILGKDSSGSKTHQKCIEKLKPFDDEKIRAYVTRKTAKNPFEANSEKAEILEEFRLGFSPTGVKTNTMLRKLIHECLNEKVSQSDTGKILPCENKNIFMMNSFVFLSEEEKTPSKIPLELFQMSVNEFVLPVIEIIKPKLVIQAGREVVTCTMDGLQNMIQTHNKSFYVKSWSSLEKLQQELHIELLHENKNYDNILSVLHWSNTQSTYFFPVNHPSRTKYFYEDKERQGYLVWSQIKKVINTKES